MIESSDVADKVWLKQAKDIRQATLFAKTPSRNFDENILGKTIAPRLQFGGLVKYRSAIDLPKTKGYGGFQFQRPSEVAVQS